MMYVKCNDVLKQYYVCKWIDCNNVDWILIKLNVQEHEPSEKK